LNSLPRSVFRSRCTFDFWFFFCVISFNAMALVMKSLLSTPMHLHGLCPCLFLSVFVVI
jgi:hypothetical protein